MKTKLFILVLLSIFAFSCSNDDIDVKDPKKSTTVQLQQLAQIDTACYKIVEMENTLYVLKDNLVVKKLNNKTGLAKNCLLFIAIITVAVWLFLIIWTRD